MTAAGSAASEGAYTDVLFARLTRELAARAEPDRAAAMAAYMRGRFPFLGVPAAQQRAALREAQRGLAAPAEPDLDAFARRCWAAAEREYQYAACAILRRWVRACGPGFLPLTEHLITTRSWWDTVDALAANVAGPMVRAYPRLSAVMDAWAAGDQLWTVRSAILHQLRFREATDADRLFGYCAARAGHPDFFIRKAIGWALREYAKTDPDAVRQFVAAHHELSGLSRREALRHLGG